MAKKVKSKEVKEVIKEKKVVSLTDLKSYCDKTKTVLIEGLKDTLHIKKSTIMKVGLSSAKYLIEKGFVKGK